MPAPLLTAAVVFAALAGLWLVLSLVAVRRRRWGRVSGGVLLGLLFLALAALCATVSISVQGYRALTHEEVAATVTAEPLGDGRLRARFRFADGQERVFDLAGEGFVVEAHIVKWHPLANLLGLHTAYQLERVAGRYDSLADEQTRPRTVYALAPPRPVDAFDLARRFAFLAPIVDAQYGSATFVSAREPVTVELRVSTSGLLLRPAPAAARPGSG
jgi:hypothetical protein